MFFKLLLCAGLLAAPGFAQRGSRGGGGGQDSGTDMTMMAQTPSRFDRIAGFLNLTKEQKKPVKAMLDEAQKEATPLREQMSKSRIQIGAAVAAGKSPDEINQMVTAYTALDAQMAVIEMGTFTKIVNSLDEPQKANRQGVGAVFLIIHGLFMGKNWND